MIISQIVGCGQMRLNGAVSMAQNRVYGKNIFPYRAPYEWRLSLPVRMEPNQVELHGANLSESIVRLAMCDEKLAKETSCEQHLGYKPPARPAVAGTDEDRHTINECYY